MSNLKAYQWVTTTSKKVGGVENLLLLTGTIGAVVSKICEVAVKKGAKYIKTRFVKKTALEAEGKLYSVTSQGTSNEGLEFAVGDQFRVLEADGDAVLIEKLGDGNNPYFVSAELLQAISDYQK